MSGLGEVYLIMAALWNKGGHYIFVLWFFFLSSSFGRKLDVYHTSTHGMVLVRI